MADFERLGIGSEIIRAIEEEGWLLPTPVQDEAIPQILCGRDVCVAVETGSGKTGAFGLPCLQVVHEALQNKATISFGSSSDKNTKEVQFHFDSNYKDSTVFLLGDKKEVKSNSDRWAGIHVTGSVKGGRYMFEIEVLCDSVIRVGWASRGANLNLGTDARGVGYGATGKLVWNNTYLDYGEQYGKGDVIGCLIDFTRNIFGFAKNGKYLGDANTIPDAIRKTCAVPAVCGRSFHARILTKDLIYKLDPFKPISLVDPKDSLESIASTLENAGRSQRNPLCLIFAPTKEISQQIYECMLQFGKYLRDPSVRIGLFIGGADERAQRQALLEGVDIAIGTVQKMSFYTRKRELDVSYVQFIVLDEADDLMKSENQGEILQFRKMAGSRSKGKVQTLFFSATLHSEEVKKAIETITRDPVWIDLKGKPSIPDTVHCVCYRVDPTVISLPFKMSQELLSTPVITDGIHNSSNISCQEELYSQRIKEMKPKICVAIADAFGMSSCLVFCRTNLDCDNFEKYLITLGGSKSFTGKTETGKENPYSCLVLAGMRDNEERQRNLELFKSGYVRFLVCTNIAARGIDIKELPYLISMTLPDDPDQYFHQVGRVGRADKLGLAISLIATRPEKVWFHKCRNRGVGCRNVNLVEKGGCCVWYDEPKYLAAIESRLDNSIAVMHLANFSVPGIIGSVHSNLKDENEKLGRRAMKTTSGPEDKQKISFSGVMAMYGKSKEGIVQKSTTRKLQEIAKSLTELQQLEKNVQKSFVSLLFRQI